jgi:hypothetical protein
MRSFCIIVLCCVIASCDYRGCAATGTVLEVTNFEAPPEQWSFRPIQGAEIVVYWEGYKPLYSHGGRAYCLATASTTSNAHGSFFVPGISMPRAVSGIEDVTAVSLAYVPGFVMLRPHEHSHPIFARRSVNGPTIHVFRRAKDSIHQDARENLLYNASFCPSQAFSEANPYEAP